MLIADSVEIEFGPFLDNRGIPFGRIIREWVEVKFDPRKCEETLRTTIESAGLDPRGFDLGAIRNGGLVLTDSLLFSQSDMWRLSFNDIVASSRKAFDLDREQVRMTGDLLRWTLKTDDRAAIIRRLKVLGFEGFVKSDPSPVSPPVWATEREPGIYRREHASLVFQSRNARVIIDPVRLARGMPRYVSLPELPDNDWFDAILISHSHGDHWHLPSIMQQAESADTLVVVPEVPRANLLCPEVLADTLTAVGQRVIAPKWGSSFKVGDIEIDVLPFYGEQPTQLPPGPPPGLRSWGNCYRINTEDYSAIVLVDTGRDPDGDMVEAVRRSVERRGPPDVILSCAREFKSPFFGGLGTYWGALRFDRLRELYGQYVDGTLPITTAGIQGIADICRVAGAKYYLPYAHGYEGLGERITDIGWTGGEPSEDETLKKLSAALLETKSATQVTEWVIGEHVRFKAGRLQVAGSRPR